MSASYPHPNLLINRSPLQHTHPVCICHTIALVLMERRTGSKYDYSNYLIAEIKPDNNVHFLNNCWFFCWNLRLMVFSLLAEAEAEEGRAILKVYHEYPHNKHHIQ